MTSPSAHCPAHKNQHKAENNYYDSVTDDPDVDVLALSCRGVDDTAGRAPDRDQAESLTIARHLARVNDEEREGAR